MKARRLDEYEMCLHTAKVYLAQARVFRERNGDIFCITLSNWAANQRRKAIEIKMDQKKPVGQQELF